jgi:hypothetical protein
LKAVREDATGAAAVISAGYSDKHAASPGVPLKTNSNFRALLNAALQAKDIESDELIAPDELMKCWSREAQGKHHSHV